MPARPLDSPMSAAPPPGKLRIADFIRPHWVSLALAFVAVIGETLADVLEPWPIKIVVDNVLQDKKLSRWATVVVERLGHDKLAILYFALAAVILIAVL